MRSPVREDLFSGQRGLSFVHGDTMSTLLSTLIAKRAGQRVVHIEAGLRSHRLLHPFPEEFIRIVVMHKADLLFAPSPQAFQNLEKMGLVDRAHLLPANTNLETLALTLRQKPTNLPILPERYSLATIHRLETLYHRPRLTQVIRFLREAHGRLPLFFVLHPPTERRLHATGLARVIAQAGITTIPLMEYAQFVQLLRKARFVITDGGSVQEEAFYLGTPCLILRKASEREEGIGENAVLSRLNKEKVREFLENFEKYRRPDRLHIYQSPSAVIADRIAMLGDRGL